MNKYLSEYKRNRKWMEEHDWDGCLWPEEATFVEAFEKGQAVEQARAFGAIRRAAEVARRYDSVWMNATDPHWSFVDHYGASADAIRSAIRAAIGSDKA